MFVVQKTVTRHEKVGRLLDYLPTRGAKAFPQLIYALVSTHQEHIAEILDPALTQRFKNSADDKPMEVSEVDSAFVAAEKSVDEKVSEIRMLF